MGKIGENMTKNEVKARLERYAGLRLEVRLRLERLAELQQMDQERPTLSGSRSDRYAQTIAPTVQTNRREMSEIEAAVAALPDPLEREVLRLRYMEPFRDPQTGRESIRATPWKGVSIVLFGSDREEHVSACWRLHSAALVHLSAGWTGPEKSKIIQS